MPFCIAVAADRLIVWDMGNRRLCLLTPDGNFLRSIPVQFGQKRPEKMRSLPDRNIVIGHSKDFEIEVYTSEKGKLFSFLHPYEPMKVAEKDKDRLIKIAGYGISE